MQVFQFNEDTNLPFKENEFDLIISRHESYAPAEVRRILEPLGHFITQQVGEQNDVDINCLLGNEPTDGVREWTSVSAAKELQGFGFEVLDQMEAFSMTWFYDVGAIVFYLRAIPWVVPDFTVEKYADALLQIHDRIQERGYIEVRNHRFLIVAQNRPLTKPK